MTFSVIDWIFGVLILIFSIIGLSKGFINNIFGKLALIGAIILSCLFYDNVSELILFSIENMVLRNVLSFLLIFVVVFLVIKILQLFFSKIVEWNILKSLDRTLGFFFGIIEGLVIVWGIIFLLSVQPFFPIDNLFKDSFFYSLISSITEKTKDAGINV